MPIRLIALDATNKVHIGPEFLREFEAKALSPLGRVVAEVLEADRETIDAGIFYAWDPLAAAALLRPSMVKTAAMHIDIQQNAPQEGRTVASRRASPTPMSPWTPMPPLSARCFSIV